MLFGGQADFHLIVGEDLDDAVGDVWLVVVAIAGCEERYPTEGVAFNAGRVVPRVRVGLRIVYFHRMLLAGGFAVVFRQLGVLVNAQTAVQCGSHRAVFVSAVDQSVDQWH